MVFKFKELNIYKENIAIIGDHYTGKTHFAIHNIAKQLIAAGVNLWVWDAHGWFSRSGYFRPENIVYYLEDIHRGTCCYVPQDRSEKNFNDFCQLVMQLRNHHVMIDEAHDYMTAQRMATYFTPIIRDMPANENVTYTCIWQKASEGKQSVFDNARHQFLFSFDVLGQKRYLQMFGKYADLHLDPKERKYFKDEMYLKEYKSYRQLAAYSYLYRDKKTREVEIYENGEQIQLSDLFTTRSITT